MIIEGRIFDIVHVSDKVAQIVLRKKDKDKYILVAISVFGYWRDKAINELKLKQKDKIKGKLHLNSKMYKEKYYTDVFFREITILEKSVNGLFVDRDTGEIL